MRLGVEAALRVLATRFFSDLRLADVEHLALLADHAVDARRVGQAVDLVADELRALQRGTLGDLDSFGHARFLGTRHGRVKGGRVAARRVWLAAWGRVGQALVRKGKSECWVRLGKAP